MDHGMERDIRRVLSERVWLRDFKGQNAENKSPSPRSCLCGSIFMGAVNLQRCNLPVM